MKISPLDPEAFRDITTVGRLPRPPGLCEDAKLVARSLRQPSLPPVSLALFARALDVTALVLALWFAEFVVSDGRLAPLQAGLAGLASAGVATLLLAQAGLYAPGRLRRFAEGAAGLIGAGLLVAAFGATGGIWSSGPWTFLAAAAPALAIAVLPARALVATVARWVVDHGLVERRAVIAGGGENAARLIRGLNANPKNDIRICGIFDDREDGRSPPVISGVPKIGRLGDLIAFARLAEIDMLIVTLPLDAENRILALLDLVRVLPVDVRLSGFASDFTFPRRQGYTFSEPGLIDVSNRPLRRNRRIAKRAFDIAVTTVALVPLLPVMALAALAIRLDSSGPVIFRQLRDGYNHKPIEVWKLRSMYADQSDPKARRIVTKDDPRVTRVGRFIRKWSIDELPQLFNVLRGDLSLVGPRPHAVNAISSRQQAFEELVEGYAGRHRVPPGVTGWAQIHGFRGEIDDPESLRRRIEHDLYYIENHSMLLDLYILAMTPLKLLDTRKAY